MHLVHVWGPQYRSNDTKFYRADGGVCGVNTWFSVLSLCLGVLFRTTGLHMAGQNASCVTAQSWYDALTLASVAESLRQLTVIGAN